MTGIKPPAGTDFNVRAGEQKRVLNGLDHVFMQVREFHEAFDHPISDTPKLMEYHRALTRANWKKEEVDEFTDPNDQNVVAQADAMIDLIYFAIGSLVEMGVMPQKLFNIVHGANMNKMHCIDGKMQVVRREDGKVVKPDGWMPPETQLAMEIHEQITSRSLKSLTRSK